jgi:CRP-like cAMP-binding protein
LSLDCFDLPNDCIVDDSSEPFPHDSDYSTDDLTTAGYTSLLRIERGRVRNRDVFGPLRLHYGLFKLRARDSNYLLARRNGRVVGAIGFTVDKFEKAARVFELISSTDDVIRFLLLTLLKRSRYELNVEYIEVDVSANAPRLQRTLLELGFAPAAYVPAMVFNDIERVDAVRMVRLLVPFRFGKMDYIESVRPFAELVLRDFQSRSVLPRVDEVIRWIRLFMGLSSEQVRRICESCEVKQHERGVVLFGEGETADCLQVVLSGEVGLSIAGRSLASVGRGQCLAERVLLDPTKAVTHHMTARTQNVVETLNLDRQKLVTLIRRRPDIGVVLYRNIAADVSEKLTDLDRRCTQS